MNLSRGAGDPVLGVLQVAARQRPDNGGIRVCARAHQDCARVLVGRGDKDAHAHLGAKGHALLRVESGPQRHCGRRCHVLHGRGLLHGGGRLRARLLLRLRRRLGGGGLGGGGLRGLGNGGGLDGLEGQGGRRAHYAGLFDAGGDPAAAPGRGGGRGGGGADGGGARRDGGRRGDGRGGARTAVRLGRAHGGGAGRLGGGRAGVRLGLRRAGGRAQGLAIDGCLLGGLRCGRRAGGGGRLGHSGGAISGDLALH
mmetsp:Transcript_35746/g.89141  ORF Transcript_35746/g.89141 Transcript_35746/m.89141 type:complete len:254 (-) Transcript_35746:514-1275(-)